MIKHSLFAAPFLLILQLLLSVVCQAEPRTERVIVELEQNVVSPNPSLSIQLRRPECSDITNTISYAGSDSPPYNKPGYGVKMTIVELTSWQLLYTTHLLMDYKLTLTTKNLPLSSNSYSRLPTELVVAVGWILQSYWKIYPLPFISMKQKETAPMLTDCDQSFATITMMLGSGQNQQQEQPPESHGQRDSGVITQATGSFIAPMYSDFDGGDGDPQKHSHTLGLNCFVHPCHGVCQLGPLSKNITTIHGMTVTPADRIIINGLLNLRGNGHSNEAGITFTVSHPRGPMGSSPSDYIPSEGAHHGQQALPNLTRDHSRQHTCVEAEVGVEGQQRPCGKVYNNLKALLNHKRRAHTGQKICCVAVVGKDDQLQSCGMVSKNAQSLSSHKYKYHTGNKICDVTVIGEDGQQRTCGKLCKNSRALMVHKGRFHTTERTCDVIVVGKDNQEQACKTLCKSAEALSDHKSKVHSGQKICGVELVEEDGQRRPCGKVVKNALALSDHKRRCHTGQEICDVNVVGEDGQQQRCGTICKNAQALSDHKCKVHSGQKTCVATVVGEDGQLRSCGKVVMNAQALSDHKRRWHTGQEICDMTVVGKDGQQQPCGKVSKNAKALTEHKRRHRKRKPVDVNRNVDHSR